MKIKEWLSNGTPKVGLQSDFCYWKINNLGFRIKVRSMINL